MPITKQTIAIIGAGGNMGSAIARHVANGNYRLLLFDQDSGKLSVLTKEITQQFPEADVKAMSCAHDCSWEADIIILAVPHKAEKEIADIIRDVATQKIVVSIANPVEEDFSKLTTARDSSAAEELQQWLPHSKVVKAFNTIFAVVFDQPVIDGKQVDTFIAGDDEQARQTVAELVETVGLNPVIAGNLSVSSTLERMQLLLMQLSVKNNGGGLAGWKILRS
jgi:NADPH-dependent F420 reductase